MAAMDGLAANLWQNCDALLPIGTEIGLTCHKITLGIEPFNVPASV